MTQLEIEAFLAIVKYGSISAAAEHLFVTQPALSRRVRALEEELGYGLFLRSKGIRSVTLTGEGSAFIPVAEKWNHVYREARSIATLSQKPVLNLASVGSVSTYLLPNILREIITEDGPYNLCFHQYHSHESYGYVENGLIDIALISDDMYHRSVLTTPAFEEPFVLAGGPAWDGTDSIHPTALNPRNEIRLPWNPEFDVWHARWFDEGILPRVRLDQMSLLEEFLTGENFAIMPLMVAKRIRHGSAHICRLEEGPENEVIYYLTSKSSEYKQPLISHFLRLLKKEVDTFEDTHSFL